MPKIKKHAKKLEALYFKIINKKFLWIEIKTRRNFDQNTPY